MNIPGESLADALDTVFAADPEAILIEGAGRRLSADRLARDAAHYAGALAALGVRKGDRVATQVEKSLEVVFLYLACLRLGAIYLPLNTAYRRAEIEYFLRDAEPHLFVCTPDRRDEYSALAASVGAKLETLGERADGTLPDLAASAPPAPREPMRADDVAAICYTSGTTGRSKGAMLTHRNLLANARALLEVWGMRRGDVLLHALPIFHVHGLFISLNAALLSGGRMLFLPRFDVDAVLAELPRSTLFMGVPTYYTRLLDDPRFNRTATAAIRLFTSGSAPLLPETFAQFEERIGQRILERYGMTETGVISSNPLDGERLPGSVGTALPGIDVRVADESGEPLPSGTVGMVEVRGPNVFAGYWRMAEKTETEFRLDGFFITGDIGELDCAGVLRLIGRSKDLIICGGLNVYPKEIEELIDRMKGVRECAIIGLPHPDFGEAVAAVVHMEPGTAMAQDDVIRPLKATIANFKVPKAVFFVDALPRNAMGKVQKNLLRDRYREAFAGRPLKQAAG